MTSHAALRRAVQLEEAVELYMFAGRPRHALRILNHCLADLASTAGPTGAVAAAQGTQSQIVVSVERNRGHTYGDLVYKVVRVQGSRVPLAPPARDSVPSRCCWVRRKVPPLPVHYLPPHVPLLLDYHHTVCCASWR